MSESLRKEHVASHVAKVLTFYMVYVFSTTGLEVGEKAFHHTDINLFIEKDTI